MRGRQFRKKPVVIEAIQFTGTNCRECLTFIGESEWVVFNSEIHDTDCPTIHTLEGDMRTSPGDWIIKGVKGEFYPCKADIFEATYDAVCETRVQDEGNKFKFNPNDLTGCVSSIDPLKAARPEYRGKP